VNLRAGRVAVDVSKGSVAFIVNGQLDSHCRNKGDTFLRNIVSHSLKDAASCPELPFVIMSIGDLLKPSGQFTYHQVNIQQFVVLPAQCICVFYVDL
jgi:hypothetical protein